MTGDGRPRILVTGVTGQVGRELLSALAPIGTIVPVSRADADLAAAGAIGACIEAVKPDVVVNAAAYTQVDRAESDASLCHRINADAVRELSDAARRVEAVVVHYSTDYVFDGRKGAPYTEDDAPNPLSVYGASKLAGERALREAGARSIVLRTGWVYGAHGRNFVRTMLSLAREREEIRVVDDQIGAPTASHAIAAATASILARVLRDADCLGTYHLTASGTTTWYDVARAILEADPRRHEQRCARVIPISTAEFGAAAPRPRYAVLDTAKVARTFGVAMQPWHEELVATLGALARGAVPPSSGAR